MAHGLLCNLVYSICMCIKCWEWVTPLQNEVIFLFVNEDAM